MKATIINELSWEEQWGIPFFALSMMFLFAIFRLFGTFSKVNRVLNYLETKPGVESEHIGSTKRGDSIDVSISVSHEKFDLASFASAVRRIGGNLISVADSEHPSFRSFMIIVPRRKSFWSISTFIVFGAIAGIAIFAQEQKAYKYIGELGKSIGLL